MTTLLKMENIERHYETPAGVVKGARRSDHRD